MIIHTWKTITGHVPNDIGMRFGVQAIVSVLKKHATRKAKACYDISFHVKAVQLWKLLPAKIKDFDS